MRPMYYRSHLSGLGEDAGSPIVELGNPAQSLPTFGTEALVTSDAVAVPTSPASPLQVQAVQPLAVENPNQVPGPGSDMPPAAPAPSNTKTTLLILAGIVGVLWLINRK